MPEQSHAITAIYVNDMGAAKSWDDPGAGNWVPLADVVFVVGSDMMGGMGVAELVPFGDPAKATAFAAEHGGTVMELDAIPQDAVVPPVAEDGSDDEDYTTRLRNLSKKDGN
jgi:copper chaperone NosL